MGLASNKALNGIWSTIKSGFSSGKAREAIETSAKLAYGKVMSYSASLNRDVISGAGKQISKSLATDAKLSSTWKRAGVYAAVGGVAGAGGGYLDGDRSAGSYGKHIAEGALLGGLGGFGHGMYKGGNTVSALKSLKGVSWRNSGAVAGEGFVMSRGAASGKGAAIMASRRGAAITNPARLLGTSEPAFKSAVKYRNLKSERLRSTIAKSGWPTTTVAASDRASQLLSGQMI